MNKTKIAQSLTAIVLGSVLAGATAMAAISVTQDARSVANTTGRTAKVKSTLVGNEAVNSNDISVETNERPSATDAIRIATRLCLRATSYWVHLLRRY